MQACVHPITSSAKWPCQFAAYEAQSVKPGKCLNLKMSVPVVIELRQTANTSETKKYRGALPITGRYLRCAGLRIPSAGRCHPVRIVNMNVAKMPIANVSHDSYC